MDGLSRWDLVLWVVVAYGVVVGLARLLFRRRPLFGRRLQQRLAMQPRGTAMAAAADERSNLV